MPADVKIRDMASDPGSRLLARVPRFATWPLIRALGQRMLAAARDGNWELALKLYGNRTTVLERFFAEPVTEDEAPAVADSVRAAQQDDAELRRLADGGRDDLQNKLQGLRAGRKARQAYLSGL